MPGGRGNVGSPSWFQDAFGFAEKSYEETRRCFQLHGEELASSVNGSRFYIGPFEHPSLGDLRSRCSELPSGSSGVGLGGCTFQNITGCVRRLHLDSRNAGSVFQVASQFNCLEMNEPGARPEDGVTRYFNDATQGPACALTCPAATVYRNYLVNDCQGQGGGHQLDCLSGVGDIVENGRNKYWRMVNGYCMPTAPGSIGKLSERLAADASFAEEVRAKLQIGIHWDTEVKGGSHRVCQMFCSALPVAYAKSTRSADWAAFACSVLEASYEATLAAAAILAMQRGERVKVYWTSVGGGAFGNRTMWIIQAMDKALTAFADAPLDVMLVHFSGVPKSAYRSLEKGRHAARARVPSADADVAVAPASDGLRSSSVLDGEIEVAAHESDCPSSMPERIAQLCERLDENGEGVLNRNDFEEILSNLDPVLFSRKALNDLFMAADCIDQDELHYKELIEWIFEEGLHGLRQSSSLGAGDGEQGAFEVAAKEKVEAACDLQGEYLVSGNASASTPSSAVIVPENVLLVGVAGPTRGGKSTLARSLREHFPGSGCLNQDRYFRLPGETPECIDWRRLKKDLKALLTAAADEVRASRRPSVVVAEGFLLFADEELESWFCPRIFLTIDRDTCYARRLATKKTGLDGDRFDREFNTKIWPAHESHGRPRLPGAHVLDGCRDPADIAAEAVSLVEVSLGALAAASEPKREQLPGRAKPEPKRGSRERSAPRQRSPAPARSPSAPRSAAADSKAKPGPKRMAGWGDTDAVLLRILEAQEANSSYSRALREIRAGHKRGHWIWYVWPTLRVLRPGTSRPGFLLPDFAAAQAYLEHDTLRQRLEEITAAAVEHLGRGCKPNELFGSSTDADKFAECMTVFAAAAVANGDEAGLQFCASALQTMSRGVLHARAAEALALGARNVSELRIELELGAVE